MATIDHRLGAISTIRLPEGGNFALSLTFTGATLTDTSGTVTAINGESTKRKPLVWSKAGYTASGSVYSFDIAPATEDDSDVAFSVVTSSGYTDYSFTVYDESGSAPYPIYLRLQGRVEWVADVGEFDAETAASTAVTVTVDGAEIAVAVTVAAQAANANKVEFIVAASDETTDLSIGTAKVTFRAPFAFLLTAVRASVNTAPTGSTLIIDVNNGVNSMLSTKLSIDASEKTSTTAASAAVINTTYDDVSDDAEITIDIDQVGSTIAGKGLKVTLIGTRA